jgi:SAF domain
LSYAPRTSSRRGSQPAAALGGTLRVAPGSRRRSPAWIAGSVLLVLVCTLAFAVGSTRLGTRQAVLALARDVPVGQVIADSDLRVVRLSVDPALHPIPSGSRGIVVGRPAAVPLLAGTLLTDAELGAPSALPPDQAVIGVPLKPGQFPPGLQAGARVLVVDTGANAGEAGQPATGDVAEARATVVGVSGPAVDAGDPSTVVAFQLDAQRAPRLAAAGAAGRVVVVLLGPRP